MQYKFHIHSPLFICQRAVFCSGSRQQSSGRAACHQHQRRTTCGCGYAAACRIRAGSCRGANFGSENRGQCRPLPQSLAAGLAAVCFLITQPAHAELTSQIFPARQAPHYLCIMPCHNRAFLPCKFNEAQHIFSKRHDKASFVICNCRQPGAASTVTVDRAWLESLLLDELGSR